MWGVEATDLVGLAGLFFVLVLVIVAVVTGRFIPASTHRVALASEQAHAEKDVRVAQSQLDALRADMSARMDAFRADHAVRVDQARVDHDKQLAALALVTEGVRRDFAAVLASKDATIEHWVGAWHIADEAGTEEIAGKLDELVAASRAFARWVEAFQDQTGVPALPQFNGIGGG